MVIENLNKSKHLYSERVKRRRKEREQWIMGDREQSRKKGKRIRENRIVQ